MPKKQSNKIIQTNYGDYVMNDATREFIQANRSWQQHDPIGFELELINRFAIKKDQTQTISSISTI